MVEALRARGVRTIAHVRPESSALAGWRERFHGLGAEVDETPWEARAIAATLRQSRPDLVFALLGTTRARAGREGLRSPYEAIDYGLSAQLLQGAIAARSAPRFIYLSAMGADEDARSAYLAVRGRLERELQESELPYLIARPAFVTGSDREERRPMERVGAVVSDALLAVVARLGGARLRAQFASLTGAQLARGLVTLALDAPKGRAEVDAAALRRAASADGVRS